MVVIQLAGTTYGQGGREGSVRVTMADRARDRILESVLCGVLFVSGRECV